VEEKIDGLGQSNLMAQDKNLDIHSHMTNNWEIILLTIGSGASLCAHITQGTVVLRFRAVSAAHFT